MAVIARLRFDTVTGPDTERIEYRLDILDEGYTGVPVELIGDGDSPVMIDTDKNIETIYKPVLGSVMDINLVVPTDTYVLPDFNAGSTFQYEVILFRIVDGSPAIRVWCGYINPLQSKEKVGTYPFRVKFTATDRLGALNDQPLIFANVQHDTTLIGYIGRALRQTGLNLPIYVESGVRNATGDALIDVASSGFSFFDDDAPFNDAEGRALGERSTLRESLEGVLTTFNCRIYQSEAKWWITNCSTHGNATDIDTTYAQFVPDTGMNGRDSMNRFPGDDGYVPSPNIEEYRRAITSDDGGPTVTVPTLRYNVDGTANEELSVYSEDLIITLREPFGSIEARPEGLSQDPLITNFDFRSRGVGYSPGTSIDQVLRFTDDAGSNSLDAFRTGGRSITTNRNDLTISSVQDVWFETVGVPINERTSTTIRFDWSFGNLTSDMNDLRIPFRIRADFPSTAFLDVTLNPDGTSTTVTPSTFGRLYWDFDNSHWERHDSPNLQATDLVDITRNQPGGTLNTYTARGGTINEWHQAETSISDLVFANYAGVQRPEDVTISVEFYFPQGYRDDLVSNKRQQRSGTGRVDVYIDKVIIFDDITDVVDPVYEYRQPNHTETEVYEPAFISQGATAYRQFLKSGDANVGLTDFWTKDETSASGRTLEELITGQKLRDNKERLQYYEGSVINRTTTPILPHNKIQFNYAGFENNGVIILNGGTWDVKQNTYDFGGYVPQDSVLDANDTFTDYNVDLLGQRFDGTRAKNRYILQVTLRGIDTLGAVVADSINPVMLIDLTDPPGTIIQRDIVITPSTGFVTNLANTIVRPGTSTEPRPVLTSFGEFANQQATVTQSGTTLGGSIVLPISIRVPNEADFEELHIDVGVTAFVPEAVPGVTAASVVITNNISGTVPRTRTFDVSGLPGSTIPFSFIIKPEDPTVLELNSSSVNPPSFTDTSLRAFPDRVVATVDTFDAVGGAVEIPFEYRVPTTPESVAVTISGNANPVASPGNNVFNLTVDFAGLPANVSLFDTGGVTHRNVQGTIVSGFNVLEPGVNAFLNATDFSASESGSVRNVRFVQSNQRVEVHYDVTIGTADSLTGNTITITAGEARLEPYSITFNPNNVGLSGASIAITGGRKSFDSSDFGMSINTPTDPPPVLTISSDDGMEFTATDIPLVQIDINEAAVATDSQGTVVFPEPQFVVLPAVNPVVDGNLVFIIAGLYPSNGGQYTIDVNVRGAANYAGQYGLVAEGARVLYSATDDRGPQRFRTAFVNIVTSPEIGRFELVGSPEGATLGTNMNGVAVSRSIPLGPELAQDTTFTVRHLDDPTLTATVIVSENLTEAEQPATMGSLSTNRTTTSSNGGTLQYTVSDVDGLWEMRFSDSPTLPFAGPGPLNNSIISFSAPSGGSNDIGGTLTYGNNGDYLRQGNRLAYIHLIAAGQTTGSSLATVQLIGAAGPVYGEQTITTLNRAPRAGDADGLYIQFP